MLAKFSYIFVAFVPERTYMVSVALNVVSHSPMYVSFVCGVTSAWYTMFRMLQFPSSGQVSLLRQLQLLSLSSDCFDGLLICGWMVRALG